MADVARLSPAMQAPFRRGLSRVEAAGYIGISPSLFDRLVFAGQMPRPKRIGARNVWDRCALDVAFEALPGEDDPTGSNEWDAVLK